VNIQELVVNPKAFWQHTHLPGDGFQGPWAQPIGYLCPYLPEEILHAAGFTPVRVLPRLVPLGPVDRHLPVNTCTLARSFLGQVLDGSLDHLAGVVFTHTCDTMQCLAEIYRLNFPHRLTANLVGPVALDAAGSRDYLLGELRNLVADLEGVTGVAVTSGRLVESIRLYNINRDLLQRLEENRAGLAALDYYTLLHAGMLMPKEQHNLLLQKVLADLPVHGQGAPRHTKTGQTMHQPRLLLAGAVLTDLALVALVEDLGGQVVADTLCSGTRYFDSPVTEGMEDPLAALADRYLNRLSCPAKHSLQDRLTPHLVDLVKQRKADGVIFLLDNFCDPHSWEYVPQAEALAAAGIPHLQLQVDHTGVTGQIRTRVQAFLERLQGGGQHG